MLFSSIHALIIITVIECVQLIEPGKTTLVCAARVKLRDPICVVQDNSIVVTCELIIDM